MSQIYPAKKYPPDKPEDQPTTFEDGRGCTDNDPYGCWTDDDSIGPKISSATDFTGLIPALPLEESELESYAEMYEYPGDIFKD